MYIQGENARFFLLCFRRSLILELQATRELLVSSLNKVQDLELENRKVPLLEKKVTLLEKTRKWVVRKNVIKMVLCIHFSLVITDLNRLPLTNWSRFWPISAHSPQWTVVYTPLLIVTSNAVPEPMTNLLMVRLYLTNQNQGSPVDIIILHCSLFRWGTASARPFSHFWSRATTTPTIQCQIGD